MQTDEPIIHQRGSFNRTRNTEILVQWPINKNIGCCVKIKKQINALQVEHLQISTKVPATRLSPVEIPVNKQETQPNSQENTIPEINLDILGSVTSGSFSVNQGEVEEEEEDE